MATPPKKPAAKPAPAKPALKAVPAKTAPDQQENDRAPGDLTISAKLSDNDLIVSVNYNFGKDLDEMCELFTPEVVYSKALDSMVIDAQALIRRAIKNSLPGRKNAKGEELKAIPLPKDKQELVANWKPSAGGKERKSAAEKVQTLVGKLSAEERAALIEKLKAAA